MEFQLDEFTTNPTEDKLDRCKTTYLVLIAKFVDVHVPIDAKKELRWQYATIFGHNLAYCNSSVLREN